MQITDWIAVGCFMFSIPQGLSGTIHVVEWNRRRKSEGIMGTDKISPPILSFILILFTFMMIGFGFWLWYHPVKPAIIQESHRTAILAQPCPPVKTGNATTHGDNSPANTGTGHFDSTAPAQFPH